MDGRGVADGNSTSTDTFVMGTFVIILMLAGAPQASACKAQFAPLTTGTSSGTSTIDFWRKEEAGEWGGAGWLGWSWDGDQLRAVELDVRHRPNDFGGDEEYVTVQSQPDVTFAVRCLPQLRTGPIVSAGIANWSLQSDGPLRVSLGRGEYQGTSNPPGRIRQMRKSCSWKVVVGRCSIRLTTLSMNPTMTLCGPATWTATANSISS